MSQSDHRTVINKYIDENYRTPSNVMIFLCVTPLECTFLDKFRGYNPKLHFLTADEIRSLSYEYHRENNNDLQKTLIFIELKLKNYYNFLLLLLYKIHLFH